VKGRIAAILMSALLVLYLVLVFQLALRLIAVDNAGDHGVFPYGTEAVDRPVIDFLLGGQRPAKTIVADALPLPGETSVFESWAPLNADGEHEDPVFTDPTMPAGTAVSSVAAGVTERLAAQSDNRAIRTAIREIYGPMGETALGFGSAPRQ